ncbi:MAG: hypothetical protein IJW73_05095 [Candidatus Gastranaerophilales bacterium]|nr:hypothetical protein [Candidatus Gastranaerophilales bacterium]
MYNSIYPININYSKHNQYRKPAENNAQPQQSAVNSDAQKNQNTFPNGTKVAIDYSKGKINISQVLTDFRSTIVAINAPDDVREEVTLYLNLVEKESLKENPSREIIVANLKNASRISDAYIASALNKPSNVVEKWIDTLFLQRINLKLDPNEVNPDFQLEFPQKAQERIDTFKKSEQLAQEKELEVETPIQEATVEEFEPTPSELEPEIKIADITPVQKDINVEQVELESDFEIAQEESGVVVQDVAPKATTQTLFSPLCEADVKARSLFGQAKRMPATNKGDIDAMNLLNEALGVMASDKNSNQNIRAAIHIERGKIFDSYDYVDFALRDYHEATKADDFNLKAQAYFKSGQIYDEFSEFTPAMDNYLSSVAYSGEAENIPAQTRVLSKIADLYTKQFDIENALQFGDLALEMAQSTNDESLMAEIHSKEAQNSQYLGENDRALENYKHALSLFSRSNESYEEMAYNYEQAAIVMRKLGNHAKAARLQQKANQCYQKAQLHAEPLEVAS